MCYKVCDFNLPLDYASLLLDDFFGKCTVLQFTFVYNHHQHYPFLDVLASLPLLFYAIQSISDDERVIKVTVVSEFSSFLLTRKLKTILKVVNDGKFKLHVFY